MPQLDESQRSFIEAPDANVRLLAPAGCGKTLCLLYRCAHLANQAQPRRPRFLIVTFTRAARDVLIGRINSESDFTDIRGNTEITTLNSWGYRRIRNAMPKHKLISKDREKLTLVLKHLKPVWIQHESIEGAINNEDWNVSRQSRQFILKLTNDLKNLGFNHLHHTTFGDFSTKWDELVGLQFGGKLERRYKTLKVLDIIQDDFESHEDVPTRQRFFDGFFRFWLEATRHLIDSAAFTIEDQKYFAYIDEVSNVEAGQFLSDGARYDHVIVDEFQDINPLDLALVKAIADRNRATLTIAGDDDQAIFEWRGTTSAYILDPSHFLDREFETHTLGVNYRSPDNIVRASQSLIAHNKPHVPKDIRSSDNATGEDALIETRHTSSLAEAMMFVETLVSDAVAGGQTPSRIALIGRKRSQLIPYQVKFAAKGIPFGAAEDLHVLLSPTFDRLLRLVSIKSACDQQKLVGYTVNELLDLCDVVRSRPLNKHDRSAIEAHLMASHPTSVVDGMQLLIPPNPEFKLGKLDADNLRTMHKAIVGFVMANSVSNTLNALRKNFVGLQRDFGKGKKDVFFLDPPFRYLAEYALSYGDDYAKFVEDIELAKHSLVHVPPFDHESSDPLPDHPVQLMTATRAKGKEFDTVVLLNVVDGSWPSRRAETKWQLEEERRLFYVAFTRARKHVAMITNWSEPISPYVSELGIDQ